MKYLIISILFLSFSPLAHAKVELFGQKKNPTNWQNVTISSYDKGQYKECEEMGLVHSRAFWGGFSTKTGMIKRMKKQIAKVGGTDLLLKDTGHGDYSGSNVGNGVIFYCPKK